MNVNFLSLFFLLPKMKNSVKKNTLVILLLLSSWLVKNILLSKDKNLDLSILILLIIFLVYKFRFKYSFAEFLSLCGVNSIDFKTLSKYVLLIVLASFILSYGLSVLLTINLNEVFANQNTDGPLVFAQYLNENYPLIITIFGLLLYSIYGTFLEELIFRGLILRKLMRFKFIYANLMQALLFGLAHFAIAALLDIPNKTKIFLFVLPFIMGLILGYAYKRTDRNMVVTWVSHYLVNTITSFFFLITGRII